MLQIDSATGTVAVTQSSSIIYGLMAVAIGQFAVLVGQWLTARNARLRESVLAKTNSDAIAAAAKIVDDRAVREREWLVEDRKQLALDLTTRNAELATKVQMTADTLAAKQAVDLANVAALGRSHALELADRVRHDQSELSDRVSHVTEITEKAVVSIGAKIDENTKLTQQVGVKADAAYNEANHVNIKISDLNKQLLRAEIDMTDKN